MEPGNVVFHGPACPIAQDHLELQGESTGHPEEPQRGLLLRVVLWLEVPVADQHGHRKEVCGRGEGAGTPPLSADHIMEGPPEGTHPLLRAKVSHNRGEGLPATCVGGIHEHHHKKVYSFVHIRPSMVVGEVPLQGDASQLLDEKVQLREHHNEVRVDKPPGAEKTFKEFHGLTDAVLHKRMSVRRGWEGVVVVGGGGGGGGGKHTTVSSSNKTRL